MKTAVASEVNRDLEILEATGRRLRILKCKKSLLKFCRTYLPDHFTDKFGPHQLRLIKIMEDIVLRGNVMDKKPGAWAMYRGGAKTTIVTAAVLWAFLYKYKRFVVFISSAMHLAAPVLHSVQVEIETNEKLREDFGDLVGKKKWGRHEFLTLTDCRMMIRGAGSKVRGLKSRERRPDWVIVDDLEDDKNAQTLDLRDQLESWLDKAVYPMLDKFGDLSMVGTVIHHDAVLARKIADPEWESEIWKAILEDGRAAWSSRLPLEKLESIRRKIGAHAFAQEYLNEPSDRKLKPFRDNLFTTYSEEDLFPKIDGNIMPIPIENFMLVDPAFAKGKASHYAGMILLGVDPENTWYVRDMYRTREGETDIIEKCFEWKATWDYRLMAIEVVFSQINLKKNIEEEMSKRNVFLSITELRSGQSKPMRIRRLVPRYEQRKIKINRDHELLRVIEEEFRTFPSGRYDDLIDALAYGQDVAYPAREAPDPKKRRRQKWAGLRDEETGYVYHENRPPPSRRGPVEVPIGDL